MKVRTSIPRFEAALQGMVGGITLYRRGIDELYLSHGFPQIHEELEALHRDLEALGMYERCRDALRRAEALVRQGPEYDREAELVLLEAGGELARASGSYDKLRRRFRAGNEVPKA